MPIVFNIYALFQAIIAFIILWVINFLISLLGYDYNLIGGTKEAFVSLQILALITAYLDVKGMKGSLFFLPTWIVLIIGSIVVFNITHDTEVVSNQAFLYLSSLLIIMIYFRLNRKELKKNWIKRKEILQVLKSKMSANDISKSDYWKLASHLYYKPSYLFLHANSVWSFLYPDVITGDEFLKFYQEFINTVDIESIESNRYNRWTHQLKKSLHSAKRFSEYQHATLSFTRFANTIDFMNEVSKNS